MTGKEYSNEEPIFGWVKVAHGWISFALDGGSGRYKCTVSDASDVVSDLVLAVARIVGGSLEERISFDHEPVEIRWNLRRFGEKVAVSVESFETWGSTSDGYVEWQGTWLTTNSLGQGFLGATESFMQDIGPDEYSSEWPSHAMPDDAIRELRASLQSAA